MIFYFLLAVFIFYAVSFIADNIRAMNNKITENSIVLITGAAMGIGKQLALNFAEYKKCKIIIMDISKDQSVVQLLEQFGSKVYYYECDLSQSDQIEKTTKQIIEKFGTIDILVNNAGIVNGTLDQYTSIEAVKHVMAVNFLAPIHLSKIFFKLFKNQKSGHIVNIASVAGYLPGIQTSDYCASKAALAAFHNCQRLEIKKQNYNIKTTLVCPYVINTGMFVGFQLNFLNEIFPMLDEKYVADVIYGGILSQREVIFIKQYYGFIPSLINVLPSKFHDFVVLLLASNAMLYFKGRKQQKI